MKEIYWIEEDIENYEEDSDDDEYERTKLYLLFREGT